MTGLPGTALSSTALWRTGRAFMLDYEYRACSPSQPSRAKLRATVRARMWTAHGPPRSRQDGGGKRRLRSSRAQAGRLAQH